MTRMPVVVFVALLAAAPVIFAGSQKPDPGTVQLEAARQKVTIELDLPGAIKLYQDIVETYAKTNRIVAATALLEMADAYTKLGSAEATKAYERILREFADQKDATAAARARLGPPTATTPRTLRPIASGRSIAWVFPDGRQLDLSDGTLVLLDASGKKRLLTPQERPSDHTETIAVSRDNTQIAYSWYTGQINRYELRTINLRETGIPSVRRLYDNEDLMSVSPAAWSPDDKWIAVNLTRKDRTRQMGLVGVHDGSLRLLKSVGWQPGRISFSPDSQFVAFSERSRDTRNAMDIFLLATDGRRQVPIVEHEGDDQPVGWSPDGGHFLFTSDRRGTVDLYALPIRGHMPAGPVERLYEIGDRRPLGFAPNGGLYLRAVSTTAEVEVATIDFETGAQIGVAERPLAALAGSNEGLDWSRDGKCLALLTTKQGKRTIGILSLETGVVTEVPGELGYSGGLRWSPDGRTFAVSSQDDKGRIGVFLVDAVTGAQRLISTPRDDQFRGFRPEWSIDGKHVYYSNGNTIVEQELATGAERVLAKRSGRTGSINPSPDGRSIATTSDDHTTLVLVPLDGSRPRDVHRLPADRRFADFPSMAFLPDGRGLIALTVRASGEGADELVLLPLDGGAARKLQIAPSVRIRMHPDGKRLALARSQRQDETFVLENVLPKRGTK